MDDFNSETDSDYTSYWRDWVSNVVDLYPRTAFEDLRPPPPASIARLASYLDFL
jgi:hypothetical protein